MPPQAPVCYRHPGRQSYVQCTRCGRYICGDCMISAAVGHQCPECVARRRGYRAADAEGRFGGKAAAGEPLVTYTLIAINVVMFVLQMASGQLENELSLWPPAVADGQYYRLVTSAFMHYGITHILFNMWALYVVGPPLEQLLGRLRFGALYGLERARRLGAGVPHLAAQQCDGRRLAVRCSACSAATFVVSRAGSSSMSAGCSA